MPCDMIVRCDVRIDLNKQGNIERFKEACRQLGYRVDYETQNAFMFSKDYVYGTFDRDKVTVDKGKEYLVDEIKQKYSELVINEKAKKFGWKIKNKGKNKFNVVKRRW